ncbi:MAG: tetratricopeptide repeat protein [Bacteroidales bacterium]|jgi:cytochrome c-type biogenesis protein CcmH/NrfG
METIEQLEKFVKTAEGSHDQTAWYKLGDLYRKNERWGDALNAYAKCMELGACNAAREASDAIHRILNFRNTDSMNP